MGSPTGVVLMQTCFLAPFSFDPSYIITRVHGLKYAAAPNSSFVQIGLKFL